MFGTPGFVFLVILAGLVVAWLVGRKRNRTPLYYGILWALLMPVWWFIGLILTLGPWHGLRSAGIIYLLAAPTILLSNLFGNQTHYLNFVGISAVFGFVLGLILGTWKRNKVKLPY